MKRVDPDRTVAIRFLICGATIAGAFFVLARSAARIGSTQHLSVLAIAGFAYALAILALFRNRAPGRRLLVLCLLFALAARIPLAVKPAGRFHDTHRYFWDARVQRAGANPYLVLPSDPAYDALHSSATRTMNNIDVPSPYPPGAQLFFRAVTAFGDSLVALKAALVGCEAMIVLLLLSWFRAIGKEPAWVLAYAWHPVAIFETASGGHFDALGTMFVLATVVALTRGWRLSATLALAAGIAIKLAPVVLAPLLFKRVRWTHALCGAALLVLLYTPFLDGWRPPPGSLGAFVDRFRFNQLLFQPVADVLGPRLSAAFAVGAGLTTAVCLRARHQELHPAAWAWPIAVALLFAPVVYPWYLIWMMPFLIVASNIPLLVWTLAIIPTYMVWAMAAKGAPWMVPETVLWMEYGAVAIAAGLVGISRFKASTSHITSRSGRPLISRRRAHGHAADGQRDESLGRPGQG